VGLYFVTLADGGDADLPKWVLGVTIFIYVSGVIGTFVTLNVDYYL